MAVKKAIQISAVVISYNEAENIAKCLSSVNWADEIIVVDAYSTDKTILLAKKYTNKIYLHKFANYSVQRNSAIHYAKGKWVLVLDADETLQRNAEDIIRKLIVKRSKIFGYWFPRRNYISDKVFLRYGYFYPDYQLRLLLNRKKLRYSGEIHEQPVISYKQTRRLIQPIIYHNPSHSKYDSFLSFRRFFPYIRVEGKEMAVKGQISDSSGVTLGLLIDGVREAARFVYRSFIKTKGYKDGYPGLRAALIYGMYILAIRIYALFIRCIKIPSPQGNASHAPGVF